MRIAILHLSDLHLSEYDNPVTSRADKIKRAFQSTGEKPKACLVVLTGDIAFSGKAREYAIAKTFFSDLRGAFQSIDDSMTIEFVFVPGNHDCDFEGVSEVRKLLIDNMPGQLSSLDPAGDITRECLRVQDQFFKFEGELASRRSIPFANRLYYERIIQVNGARIKFNCYNTAWLAQLNSEFAPLLYPLHVAINRNTNENNEDLVLSAFHYPYTWLEPNNSLEFKRHIDKTSDIILSGHEHVQRAYRKHFSTGEEVNYAEGAALQEPGSSQSGFNILIIDIDSETQKVFHFQWMDDIYAQQGDANWQPFRRNILIARLGFENNDDYARELSRIGAGFTHPRKKNLGVRDLFVYPDLLEVAFDKRVEGKRRHLTKGEDIHEYIETHRKLVFVGPAQAGKSTLCQVLYRDLQEQRIIPIKLNGDQASWLTREQFLNGMGHVFGSQYHPELFEHYKQLDSAERALIIDDFHKCPLNSSGRNAFLRLASEWFDTVFLFASELFHLEVLTASGDEPRSLLEFTHCLLRPFGWRLRGRLIEKWLILGREFTTNEAQLDRDTRQFEKIISAIIGKNLLPPFPIVVLGILQTIEATRNHDLGSGSFGYIYESLITAALAKVSQKPTDIEKIYTVLSRLAYHMFAGEKSALSRDEIDCVLGNYFRLYGVNFNVDRFLCDLEDAHMLRLEEDRYRFEHNYCYYYFVARYFKEHFNDTTEGPRLHAQAREMVDTVHFEAYAQILVFLIYLTKDVELINRIRDNASLIYSGHTPCNMQSDVAFVNEVYKEQPQRELPPSSPEDNRERHREQLDQTEEDQELQRLEDFNQKVKYSEDLDELIKLNIAFKTMQLMGQVARNFPYSLTAETKLSLVRNNYLLGLRTLNALLSLTKNNLEASKEYYASLIRERRALPADAKLDTETTAFLIWLMLAIGYGIVKKVSHSVGAEELNQTFREILETLEPQLAVRLLDVSIKLDHFGTVPMSEIESLKQDVYTNPYANTLLRDLVADHLYLFHCDQRIRQKLGALLDIKITDPLIVDNRSKQLKKVDGASA